MKTPIQLLLISVGCNIFLIAHAWLAGHSPESANGGSAAHPASRLTKPVMENRMSSAENTAAVERTQAFDWSLVESADYRVYIANLRAIKCPEETIRDLVFADIRKLFTAKRRELFQSTAATRTQREMDLANLKLQEGATLDALLGTGWRADGSTLADDSVAGERLAFLEPSQAARVRQVEERCEALVQARIAQAAGFITDDDQQELRRLEKNRYQELAKVLDEKDYLQYLRAHHPVAGQMDSEGFPYRDNQEFLAILAEREKLREITDSDTTPATQADHATRLRTLLGDARYVSYQRFQTQTYRELHQLTCRFRLAEEVPGQIQDLLDRLSTACQQLKNQNVEEQAAATYREALARQTDDQILSLLGAAAYQAWQNAGLGIVAIN